jgi:tetratricopeptide (TPR) repeat protein
VESEAESGYGEVELEPVDLDSIEAELPGDGGGLELATDGLDIEPTTIGDEEGTAIDEPVLDDLEEAFAAEPEVEVLEPEAPPAPEVAPVPEVPPEPEAPPAPPSAAERVAKLEAQLGSEGRQPVLLVQMAEALLETGGREKATFCLGEAAEIYEQQGEFREAGRVIDELLQLNVNDVRAYQKRVELALRAKDRPALIDAYLGLADCLDRTDAGNKARAVYARVLELDPENGRAAAALEMFGVEPEQPEPAAASSTAATVPGDDYVDLGTLVVEDEKGDKSTRFKIAAADPQSEAEVNFAEMLNQFKSKVAETIEEEDASSHYDLGLVYKEMDLVDEAIAEFQIAARSIEYRLRAIEELGSCFLKKQDFRIALKVLGRALQVPDYKDEELVGIFYAMGRAFEALGETPRALEWYERVMGVDVAFRDASNRVTALRS